jgi:hypothetical protein
MDYDFEFPPTQRAHIDDASAGSGGGCRGRDEGGAYREKWNQASQEPVHE